MNPVNFNVSDYDRAAPYGTGAAKVGGNYAGSMYPHELAAQSGYADCIYLDPATHTKIEEVGAANFFGITGVTICYAEVAVSSAQHHQIFFALFGGAIIAHAGCRARCLY